MSGFVNELKFCVDLKKKQYKFSFYGYNAKEDLELFSLKSMNKLKSYGVTCVTGYFHSCVVFSFFFGFWSSFMGLGNEGDIIFGVHSLSKWLWKKPCMNTIKSA